MSPLTDLQRRVLGVLIEKQLSQPQYYPLSLNALVTGCNQKSNRDPVMELDEAGIYDTLEELRGRDLISRVLAGGGSRVDRFRHDAGKVLGWSTPQLAVMAELLLRGPQTVGELRTRCSRMHPFAGLDAVATVLNELAQMEPPVVTVMPREPGRSAVRYRHTLYEASEAPAPAAASSAADAASSRASLRSAPPSAATPAAAPAATAANDAALAALREELDNVQSELADVHEQMAELSRRLAAVEDHFSG